MARWMIASMPYVTVRGPLVSLVDHCSPFHPKTSRLETPIANRRYARDLSSCDVNICLKSILTIFIRQDSGYEALFYDEGTFYVVRESVNLGNGRTEAFHAIIEELSVNSYDYDVIQACPSEFKFEGARCDISTRIPCGEERSFANIYSCFV